MARKPEEQVETAPGDSTDSTGMALPLMAVSTVALLAMVSYLLTATLRQDSAAGDPGQAKTPAARAAAWAGTPPKPSPRAGNTDDDATEASFFAEAPEVIELGWGWSQTRAEPIPTVCIEFEEKQRKAQTSNITISEVRDTYALAKEMKVSASASVRAVGYSASGKAEFAKNSSVSSSSVTYLVNAEVLNSARFVAPPSEAIPGRRAVRLTEAAASMARTDLGRFQDTCGEGYVAATISGARAYLLASTKTASKSERDSVRASVSGSGWGVKVSAAASGSTASKTEKFERNLTFFQQGGAASAAPEQSDLPKDAAEAIARIQKLASAAADAGKLFEVQITPYQVLQNFPRGADLLPEEEEHDEITALWASYAQLYGDLTAVLNAPEDYRMPLRVCAKGDTVTCSTAISAIAGNANALRLVADMQDNALLALKRIESEAEQCLASEAGCDFDVTQVRSPYAIRASLPVFFKTRAAEPDESAPPQPAPPTLDDHLSIQLREPSSGRCAFGAQTPGCISNATIRAWQARAGMASRVSLTAAEMGKTLEKCVSDPKTDLLLGDGDDPSAPTIWFPASLALDGDGMPHCPG